jgi:hypothetical protein
MRNQLSRTLNVKPVFSRRVLVPRCLVSWNDSRRAYTAYRLCAPFPAGGVRFPVHTRRTPKLSVAMTATRILPPALRTNLVERRHLPNALRLATTSGTTLFVADAKTSVQGVRITSSDRRPSRSVDDDDPVEYDIPCLAYITCLW